MRWLYAVVSCPVCTRLAKLAEAGVEKTKDLDLSSLGRLTKTSPIDNLD
jgi:hypothetical protein